jgi:hypothetical protein
MEQPPVGGPALGASNRRLVEEFFRENPTASVGTAVERLGLSQPTILKHRRAIGLPVVSRPRRSPEERERQLRAARSAIKAGTTRVEIAGRLGTSRATISRALLAIGVMYEVPTKYPVPEPRLCLTCGKEFTPRRDQAGRGHGFYCSPDCAGHKVVSEESRERMRLGHRRRSPIAEGVRRNRIAEAVRGTTRPDMRRRHNDDREYHYRCIVRLIEARKQSDNPYSPKATRRWKGRLGALLKGGRPKGRLSYWTAAALPAITQVRQEFIESHGREPSFRELEGLTGVPKSTLSRLSH